MGTRTFEAEIYGMYDPKVGWSKLIPIAFGTFPTFEQFECAFNIVCADSNGLFRFENDPNVGTDELCAQELWHKVQEIYYFKENFDRDKEKDELWCSGVLGILGWKCVRQNLKISYAEKVEMFHIYKLDSQNQKWQPIAAVGDLEEAQKIAQNLSKYPTPYCNEEGQTKIYDDAEMIHEYEGGKETTLYRNDS